MSKKILTTVLSAILIMGMSTTAFASNNTNSNEKVGDTITCNSQKYTVYQENEDGTLYALSEDSVVTYATCDHRALEPINPTPYPPVMTSYPTTKTPDYCYKKRTVQDARCISCRQTGFTIFGAWSTVAHDYPWFFGTKCNDCGYEK